MTRFGTTTTQDVSNRTRAYLASEFLKVMYPRLLLCLFAQHALIPKNQTEVIEWRRYLPLPTDPKVLAEGVTPKPGKMQWEDVAAALKEYYDLCMITNRVEDTHTDPTLQLSKDYLGKAAAVMFEKITAAELLGGINVFYSNGASRSAVNATVNYSLIQNVVRMLERNLAEPITKALSSTPSYGTEAVDDCYIAVCHSDLAKDIQNCDRFVEKKNYGSVTPYPQEIGAIGPVRFLKNNVLTAWAGAGGDAGGTVLTSSGGKADVYPVLIFGADAYGCVALKGYKTKNADGKGTAVSPVEISVVPVDKRDKDDPLGQRGYVGWKSYYVAKILQDLWMSRVEVACSI